MHDKINQRKIFSVFTIAIFLIMFQFSCGPNNTTTGTNRSFWTIDITKNYNSDSTAWLLINTGLAKTGTHCLIYLENGQSVSGTTIDDLANEFDNNMWPIINNNFAYPTDIDNNGKIIILLMDIKDGFNPPTNSAYVGGYFFPADLYTNAQISASGYPSYFKSNEAEILYIDISPNDPTTSDGQSTIIHEFQHLANFSRNVISESRNSLPTWIDEGFSTSAEAIYQNVHILASREAWYSKDPLLLGDSTNGIPEDHIKSITYGYPLVLWDIYPNSSYAVLNNYALSHLFFAWLRIQMNSDSFFKNINNNSTDNTIQDVIDVCSATIGLPDNTWPTMLGRWHMANLLGGNGKASGLESYNGLNSHAGPHFFSGTSNNAVQIYPSGAMHFFGDLYNAWTPAGGDSQIKYELGDTTSPGTSDYDAPFGTGSSVSALIVFNGESSGTALSTSAVLKTFDFAPELLTSSENSTSKLRSIKNTDASKLPLGAFRKGLEPKGEDLEELNNR